MTLLPAVRDRNVQKRMRKVLRKKLCMMLKLEIGGNWNARKIVRKACDIQIIRTKTELLLLYNLFPVTKTGYCTAYLWDIFLGSEEGKTNKNMHGKNIRT